VTGAGSDSELEMVKPFGSKVMARLDCGTVMEEKVISRESKG